jgi:hypothetical protein
MQRRCCSWAWFGDENHWSCSDDGEPAGTVRPLRLTACNAQRAAAVGRHRGPPHSKAHARQKNVLGVIAGGPTNSLRDRAAAAPLRCRVRGKSQFSLRASILCVARDMRRTMLVSRCMLRGVRRVAESVLAGPPPRCGACGDCRAEGVARTGLLPRVQKRWFGGAKLGAGNPQSAIDHRVP